MAIAVVPAVAWAHTGEPLAPHDLWTAWEWTPSILIPVLASGALYALGLSRLWRYGAGRGIRRWEAACFGAGWVVLALALLSPLHPLGEALFSAHMVQHELLMVVAAPLLVLGRPLVPWLHAIPMSSRRAIGGLTKNRQFRRGITPPEDQQLAGLIMWIPAGISYLVAALLLTARWLQDPGSAAVRKTLLRGAASAAASSS